MGLIPSGRPPSLSARITSFGWAIISRLDEVFAVGSSLLVSLSIVMVGLSVIPSGEPYFC